MIASQDMIVTAYIRKEVMHIEIVPVASHANIIFNLCADSSICSKITNKNLRYK